MPVTISPFGTLPDGRAVQKVCLQNGRGTQVCVLTYGATIQSFLWDGIDVVLGFDTLEGYLTQGKAYLGATVGRYANRLRDGRFSLNGQVYDVGCNESGRGHLHGGAVGFDKNIWEFEVITQGEEPCVTFQLLSPDGDQGYPGTLSLRLSLLLTRGDVLRLQYEAQTDRDTVLNVTQHSYFTLNGPAGGEILDTVLQIPAHAIVPVDDKLIPTGELMPVAGTPFDFREPKPIGRDLFADHPQLQLAHGYDHNFVLGQPGVRKHAVTAVSPRTGLRLDCYTDQPGLQLYTANGLNLPVGKGGAPLRPHTAFCLETQHFPDSPNQPSFPSTVLRAGETFRSVTEYRISRDAE